MLAIRLGSTPCLFSLWFFFVPLALSEEVTCGCDPLSVFSGFNAECCELVGPSLILFKLAWIAGSETRWPLTETSRELLLWACTYFRIAGGYTSSHLLRDLSSPSRIAVRTALSVLNLSLATD